MEEELNPIEIANRNSVTLGDLVVLDARAVAPIVELDENTFTAKRGPETIVRRYDISIILKQDRTGYLVGENL